MLRLLLAFALATDVTADRIAWLAENVVALRSIDPQDKDFADLQPLKRSIGNARIVSLGGLSAETHTVQVKQRLIRFLHEEMGFDVLACETPLFDGEEIDQALSGETAPRADLRQEFAPILDSPEVLAYFRATHQTTRPLHVSGFGMQVSPYMLQEYTKQLFRFIDRVGPHIATAADRKALKALLDPHADKQLWQTRATAGLGAMARVSENLGRLALTGANARELLLYRQTVADIALWVSGRSSNPSLINTPNDFLWIAKVWNADRKIIVWSSNSAIVRDLPNQQNPGSIISKEFGKSAYTIAFAEINTSPNPPAPLGLEEYFHAAGHPYSFLDLRGLAPEHWLREPLTARLVTNPGLYAWPLHFDAVLSLDLTLANNPK